MAGSDAVLQKKKVNTVALFLSRVLQQSTAFCPARVKQ